ncbi:MULTISPECIES: IPT/TIG domain-containing protein [unclassified Streptomyces]|uniref:IPT/TIG domain-containing protein n=1 Tax=unclassified Streptomyces TaxID=2593676 RepID=UPI0037FC834E
MIYVANRYDDSVTAVDSASGAAVATVPVGTGPSDVALTPDGSQAYVTNYEGDSVSVIDTATHTVAATIPVGPSPMPVVVSPDGARVYVAHMGSPGGVEVIDTSSLTVAATLPLSGYPGMIALSPDGGRLYIGITDPPNGSVAVVDTATLAVTATIPVADPAGIAVSPDGTRLYVSGYNNSTISVINTATNTVTATIMVGSQPQRIAVTPDGGSVYVSNWTANTVSVIDAGTNTMTATVPVGAGPAAVLADPDGSRVYVANAFSNTMSVIDTATRTVITTVPTGSRPYGLAIGKAVLPAVTTLAPDHGPTAGGTTVTLTGTHLTGTTAVTFDGTPASGVTVVDDTTVTAVAPPHTAGAADVTLTAKGRTVPAGSYTYHVPAPTLTGIAPTTGPVAGGTIVTLIGSNLAGATAVTFGTTPATSFHVDSDTQITATAPAASAAGPADITVTTPGGTSAVVTAGRYAYTKDTAKLTASPLLLSITPGQLNINLNLSATLTDITTGKPVPGAPIKFTVGTTTVCTATTNAAGTATCTGPCPVTAVLLNLGYTATYAGSPTLEPTSVTAGLIRIG